MKLHNIILVPASTLFLFCAACGTATRTPEPLTVGEAVSTLIALTDEAATHSAGLKAPPTSTPTFATPLLYINDDTQCRTGTSPNFQSVAALSRGTTVELVGKDTLQSAWLIKAPTSADVCWVLAGDGSPSGDYESLPEVTPQPSAQNAPPPPLDKGSIIANFACSYPGSSGESITTILSWFAPKYVNGYRIFRGDTQIADLPASTTTYQDTTVIVPAGSVTYGISVYNDVGESSQTKITVVCSR
ncbi:MAG TPA: hypothetical protein VLX61_15640 [Anaerolineales bacterium]|nr:hypothetical protein [Anaerolineales bacterium]